MKEHEKEKLRRALDEYTKLMRFGDTGRKQGTIMLSEVFADEFNKALSQILSADIKSLSEIVWDADAKSEGRNQVELPRPPFNAEYLLYLIFQKEERDILIGDLTEAYGRILRRFSKRRADIWFYKQVFGSVWPLFRRALFKIGALVWLGRILRRLIS